MEWYQEQTTLVSVGSWLDSTGFFSETGDVVNFFEKPWHYSREYKVYQFFQKENTKCPDCGEIDECSCYQNYTDIDEYLEKLEEIVA